MDRIKILISLLGMIVMSIIIQLCCLVLFPVYLVGAMFWKPEVFYKVSSSYYKSITE